MARFARARKAVSARRCGRSMPVPCGRIHGHRFAGVFVRPAQALLERHCAPAFAQCPSLGGRQRLEPAECRIDPGAFLGGEIVEGACVLAPLQALFRGHLRPARQTLLDLLLARGRQGRPAHCVFSKPVLTLWVQLAPLPLQGREHALLPGTQARPRQRLFGCASSRPPRLRRVLRGNRRARLGPRHARCGHKAYRSQQHREFRGAHAQCPSLADAEATAGCVASHR